MGLIVDKKYEGIISIQNYIWDTKPETLIKLKNIFSEHKIKIINK